jgi:hypothetical protein
VPAIPPDEVRFAPLDAPARFGYFVLQARAARRAGVLEVSGVIENLVTAEKRPFHRAEQLPELLRDWGMDATTD